MDRRWMIIGVLVLVACEDKAKRPFDVCVNDEARGDVFDAQFHCREAVSVDPQSKSGKAAAAKLPGLTEKVEAKKKADDAAATASAQAAAAKKAAQDTEDGKCRRWSRICTLGRFPDGSEQTTGRQAFDTKAECLSFGTSMGNIPCEPCRCMP